MRFARCLYNNVPYFAQLDLDSAKLLTGDFLGGSHDVLTTVPINSVRLLPPCLPSKIVAAGINYALHAPEIHFDIPSEPLIFIKPSTSVIGPDDVIKLPPMSKQVEYEGELAVVIGSTAKDVVRDRALDYVFGYTCINDVTARDLQRKDVQFTRSKSFDTFAPIGPWIETDLDPANVTVKTFLNGEKRQDSSTSALIRSVPELISFISQIMTLLPGDIIATGTPAGVGLISPGDVVSIIIDQIGMLTNSVDLLGNH